MASAAGEYRLEHLDGGSHLLHRADRDACMVHQRWELPPDEDTALGAGLVELPYVAPDVHHDEGCFRRDRRIPERRHRATRELARLMVAGPFGGLQPVIPEG